MACLELKVEVLLVRLWREAVSQQEAGCRVLRFGSQQVTLAQGAALYQRQPLVVQLLHSPRNEDFQCALNDSLIALLPLSSLLKTCRAPGLDAKSSNKVRSQQPAMLRSGMLLAFSWQVQAHT